MYNLLRSTDITSAEGLPQRGPTQLIEPKCTEPYYTKDALPSLSTQSVQSATTPNHYNLLTTEEALPHLSIPSMQNPTTPNQYNLLRNEEPLPS